MRTIHKVVLDITDQQLIYVQPGARPLSVAMQRGNLCLWYTVPDDRAEKTESMNVYVLGTGNDHGDWPTANFIGTVLMAGDSLVWHVFAEATR